MQILVLMEKILYVIFIFFVTVFSSCGYCSKKTNDHVAKYNNANTVYSKDAHQIENTFISNVEEIRKLIAEKDSFEAGSLPDIDPKELFMPYALRYNQKYLRYEASPVVTSKQITVNVDTIVYNRDSLLCVALICIEKHYTNIYPYEPKGNYYDGKAVIGCRDSINSPFKLYPFLILDIVSYENKKDVCRDLRRYYFVDIAGHLAPGGTNLEGDIYPCGLSSPDFFTVAPEFKLNKYGEYKFKYYMSLGKEYPYYK